ncbi:hypothetical protein J4O75_11815 [Paenibacillus pabuli]
MGDSEGNLRDLTNKEIKKATELFTFTNTTYSKFIKELRAIEVHVIG